MYSSTFTLKKNWLNGPQEIVDSDDGAYYMLRVQIDFDLHSIQYE